MFTKLRDLFSTDGLKKFIWGDYSVILVFLLIFFILSLIAPNFLTLRNLTNLIRRIALTGIVALGVTVVILIAEIDLSVGSVAGLTGMLAAGMNVRYGLPPFLSFLLPLVIAVAIGIGMGLIVTKLKVNSFVVTLGMLSVGRGLTLIYAQGRPISGVSDGFTTLGAGDLGSVPIPIIIYGLLIIAFYWTMTQTVFGRYVYAIGGNEKSADMLGLPVHKIKIAAFALSSLMAGIGGEILASRLYSGQTRAGTGMELDVIAAVVIGGTSLSGGRGGIFQTVAGSLILGSLANGLNLLGIGSWYQRVFSGSIIVIAVALDRYRRRRESP